MAKRALTVAGTENDPTVEFTDLTIDETTYHLVYDFNAIAEAEKLCGIGLLHGIAAVLSSGAVTAGELRGLLYAALRKAHPKITLSAAGHLVRLDTMPGITNALAGAWIASLPTELQERINAEEEKRQNPPEGDAPAPRGD
jgi:hypothetical protein